MKKILIFIVTTIFVPLLSLSDPNSVLALDTTPCKAGAIASLNQCLVKLEAGTISRIEITNKINCNNIARCEFIIQNVTQGEIFGTPGSNAGFIRTDLYDYNIFKIINSTNLTISNLTFDDNIGSPNCIYTEYLVKCKPQINISSSSIIVLNALKLFNSKAQAIILQEVNNFTFKNSELTGTYVQGIWMKPDSVNGVRILNNIFKDTFASALFIAGTNIIINDNVFIHNQWKPPWITQGGQINIYKVNNLLIENNEIKDGKYDNHPTGITPGIEFHSKLLNKNVTIRNNNIHDNSGWGIVGGIYNTIINMENVLVTQNILNNNKEPMIVDLGNQNDWVVRNNYCNSIPCPDISPSPLNSADLNADSKVDILDYNILLSNFGKMGAAGWIPADIVKNGKVDIFDYNALVTNFRK